MGLEKGIEQVWKNHEQIIKKGGTNEEKNIKKSMREKGEKNCLQEICYGGGTPAGMNPRSEGDQGEPAGKNLTA